MLNQIQGVCSTKQLMHTMLDPYKAAATPECNPNVSPSEL